MLGDRDILQKVYSEEEISKFYISLHWKHLVYVICGLYNDEWETYPRHSCCYYDCPDEYCDLVTEKLSDRFLESLNINYINIRGLSPEFISYINKLPYDATFLKAVMKKA